MLYYCKKCGRIVDLGPDILNFKEECDRCYNKIEQVPAEYWLNGINFIMNPDKEQEFIEKYITSNPDYDPKFAEQKHLEAENKIKAHEAARTKFEEKSNKYEVKCPYCHSTNTKKISGLSKAGSVALFGVFALGKTTKQWHCDNCGSDF